MAEHPSANDLGDAVRSLDFEAVKCSLDAGGDPNARGITGWTPLHYVCWFGREDLVKLLLSRGADVNAKNDAGETPLHWAFSNGRTDTVILLLTVGADVNVKDNAGETLLHRSCECEKFDLSLLLIEYGADVNAKNKWGFTPLHWACKYYSLGLARMLLKNGADPNARDDNGAAPMDMILTNELANEYFAKAVKKAIARTHAAGRPSFHGDGFGLFYLYPDGHKEYISEAEADEILKGRDRYNTDPETLLKKRSDDVSKH